MPQFRRVRRSVLVYAPRPATTRWINEELVGEDCKVVVVPSIAVLVSRLGERSDQIAIVDFDTIDDAGIAAIAAIRYDAWKGPLVAIGRVEGPVRTLLRVTEILLRPLGSERLRKLIANLATGVVCGTPGETDESTSETMPFR
ncbi:MAG TPA: hypothetical protein VL326_06655 [Kofleriaceae bacterium]|jgi:hypothetical protein|nr:hypothetical protein [Kofleriaceae bacterium]